MNKLLLITITVTMTLMLSACGLGSSIGATVTGNSTHCIEGVKYIQFRNGASVMYNRDGSLKLC